jgi:CubicO group peptidase (beta-lactamase class C family)
MLFQEPDMGAYAASKPLAHAPGTVWSYSSGTANLLSRIVFQKSGGSLKSTEAYAQAHLFGPAGMTSALIEPDESGNFVGSSYMYATARDWARFGLLCLDRGTINGQRLLSEGTVDFFARPAPADARRGYAALFWLNGVDHGKREFPHLPNFFAAEGHNDEFVTIFPSRDAVIVRLGWTTGGAEFDRDKHFAAILAALPVPAIPPVPKAEPLPNDDDTMAE